MRCLWIYTHCFNTKFVHSLQFRPTCVGKHLVLGTLEDIFKAEVLSSLSKLASKSISLFGDQVQLLLRFLDHNSSSSMKSMALKCLYFMFHRKICPSTIPSTVFSKLLPLVNDEDFQLHCKRNALRILQKILCGKTPSIHDQNGSELSKLLLAAESSLHSSSWEMQATAIEIPVEITCFVKQGRSDLTITILKDSAFSYTECQGITNRMSLTSEENCDDRHQYKIIATIVNHSISLVNQIINKENEKATSRSICISSDLRTKYKVLFSHMLKLVLCYPSAATIVLDKLRWLVKELSQINDGGYCDVICAESFQTGAAFEMNTSRDNVELLATTPEASLFETDTCKSQLSSTALNWKRSEPVIHDLILCMFKCANACHDILFKRYGDRCSLHTCIKDLLGCVHQHASQYWSTYETFHMIMCNCVARNTCKSRDNDQGAVDSKVPTMFFTPPVWIARELCALRMTKMLVKKKKYWEAYRSSMYCCCTGLWFTASFVFRKLADAFEPGSFCFWYKSLLLFSAGEIEMKLCLFPSATMKLVGELKTEGDLSEDLYCAKTDADSTLSGSQELHAYREKIIGIRGRTILANDALVLKASSDWDFVFQRWFISLRSSFFEVLTDVLGILSAHSSAYEVREGKLTVPEELLNDQVLALAHCSLRLGDLAKSYDLLASSHMDVDQHSFSSIARLAFMCSLLAFCTAYSVDLSKMYGHVEPCKFLKRFSHASFLQDLQGRVDGSNTQIISQLREFMPTSFGDLNCLQSSTRMSCSGNLEKDLYSLCHFTVASLLRIYGDAKAIKKTNGEGCLSALYGGLQFLSRILLQFMELPFVVPKYFFSVRPCFGAELYMFDSNPVNRRGISIEPGFQLSLTLWMDWKRVLDRTPIRFVKLYCILAASSESCLDSSRTRSKQFEPQKTTEMVELNTKLLHYIKNKLSKSREDKNFHSSTNMVTAFACFEPTDSGRGFSSCLLDVSSFPEGSYQIKWHACSVDENGSYYCLLPLNDSAVFSVRKP